MKKPVFKHERENVIMSCFGDLSEDAARIAANEVTKMEKELIDWVNKKLDEAESTEKMGVTTTGVIEKAFKMARNPLELFFLGMRIGKCMSSMESNPLHELIKSIKDYQTDEDND